VIVFHYDIVHILAELPQKYNNGLDNSRIVYAVYLEKRAEGFNLIHRIDIERPYVVCPKLEGKEWAYLPRKIGNINTLGITQLINHVLDFYPGNISTSLTKPLIRGRPDVSS
jgi:hypothetical protein